MQSENRGFFLNKFQKSILFAILIFAISSLFFFKNIFFQSTLLLKSFGSLSIDPEIAFQNNKPTFLEFYAEWCEVCKEMAPKVASLRDEFEQDINFVFLNVDNPKWDRYIRKYNVNGIPQVNMFDSQGNLKDTFIGSQSEDSYIKSLKNLNSENSHSEFLSSEYSLLKKNKNYKFSPRSHG